MSYAQAILECWMRDFTYAEYVVFCTEHVKAHVVPEAAYLMCCAAYDLDLETNIGN